MKLLFIGDIVGSPGMAIVRKGVAVLRAVEGIDLVVANAENAANGSGLTPSQYRQLRAAGVDIVTMGDHIYKKFELESVLENAEEMIVKPANYPTVAPGREYAIATTPSGLRIAVISLLGRTYMRPVDCPFAAADRVLAALPADIRIILVDVHAEATGDKYLLAHYLDGRVSAVLGTHTHVPTADEQILPGGTAFQCDVGMTGPHAGVLGRRVEPVLKATITFTPTMYDVASDDVRLGGAIVEIDEQTGRAIQIKRAVWKLAEIELLVKSLGE